jgi:predicted nucleotidyltransferase
MNAAAKVIRHLEDRGVAVALIGGLALGAHGIARATLDADLLVADETVLDAGFWTTLAELEAPEIRRGDAEDPLLGIVRFTTADEPVDVIVGRGAWIASILQRCLRIEAGGHSLPLVDRADLVLLKLFAAGPQDLLDIRLLLEADEGSLRRTVEERLPSAPAPVGAAWRELSLP